jgi:hypothetical protein
MKRSNVGAPFGICSNMNLAIYRRVLNGKMDMSGYMEKRICWGLCVDVYYIKHFPKVLFGSGRVTLLCMENKGCAGRPESGQICPCSESISCLK